jgi:hypothetical protein
MPVPIVGMRGTSTGDCTAGGITLGVAGEFASWTVGL